VAPLAGAAIAGLVFRISDTADSTEGTAVAGAAAHDQDAASAEAAGGAGPDAGDSSVPAGDDDGGEASGAEPHLPAARTAAPDKQARNVNEAQEFFEGKRS
jgi:aquaporin Z